VHSHVREYHTPQNSEPVEWFLLTTLAIESAEDALACVTWCKLRWRIEDWHRVLKLGCGIEKLQHKTAKQLKRVIAMNMVAAWRIMLMTLLGREAPELPCDILFSDIEIKISEVYAQKNMQCPETLGVAIKIVAKMGGYLGRKNDPDPGRQIMWRGYNYLQAMSEGALLFYE
jgi:hypothetical protein